MSIIDVLLEQKLVLMLLGATGSLMFIGVLVIVGARLQSIRIAGKRRRLEAKAAARAAYEAKMAQASQLADPDAANSPKGSSAAKSASQAKRPVGAAAAQPNVAAAANAMSAAFAQAAGQPAAPAPAAPAETATPNASETASELTDTMKDLLSVFGDDNAAARREVLLKELGESRIDELTALAAQINEQLRQRFGRPAKSASEQAHVKEKVR